MLELGVWLASSPLASARLSGGRNKMGDHPGILLTIVLILIAPINAAGYYLQYWKTPKK